MNNDKFFLQESSYETWKDKYAVSGETPLDSLMRVAKATARVEDNDFKVNYWTDKFFDLFKRKGFSGGGRIMANAGADAYRKNASLINCTTLPVVPDSIKGLLAVQAEAVTLLAAGCGVGYNFSMIRPKGAPIGGLGANTSGALSFMHTFDEWCGQIMSAGGRRGAQMGVMDCQHPEIIDYIKEKHSDGALRYFNLSIGIYDRFIDAVESDSDWELWHWKKVSNPDEVIVGQIKNLHGDDMPYYYPEYRYFRFDADHTEVRIGDKGINDIYEKYVDRSIKAKELWDIMMESTYDYSEPGILNMDAINNMNPLGFKEVINQTNPCGEQPLPGHASCLLGSMILIAYVRNPFTENASFDWDQFAEDIRTANRFLDNIVEINKLPVKPYEDAIKDTRRHGLGITGIGSCMPMLGLVYGSEEAKEFLTEVMRVLSAESYKQGIQLAKEKGCCPSLSSKEDREKYINSPYFNNVFGDKTVERELFNTMVREHGIRYTHAISIAPTGTMSFTWGDNCSNGIEPVFSYGYKRNIRLPGRNTKKQVTVYDVALLKYIEHLENFIKTERDGFEVMEANEQLDRIDVNDPSTLPEIFTLNSTDNLTTKQHIDMQAIAQYYTDSAVSKTINVPTDIDFKDFKDVYMYAFKNGLKGCTTFRYNPEAMGVVLVKDSDLQNTFYKFTTDSGEEYELRADEAIMYDGEETTAGNLFEALKEGQYGRM